MTKEKPELPPEKIIALLEELKEGLQFEDWFYDTVYLVQGLSALVEKYPEYRLPYDLSGYTHELLEKSYRSKGKRPDLPKDKIMALLTELKSGLKFEDRIEDAVYLERGIESGMEKFTEFKAPYNCEQYIHYFMDSLYFESAAVEPLLRNRLGSWKDTFDIKIRAMAKKHGKEKEILPYLRAVMDYELNCYLDLNYMARLEEGEEIWYTEIKNYQTACEENRLWLADAYQEASEICKRAGAIEQMEEYRSLSQRLSKNDLRESLPKAEKTKMDEALFWSILRDTWESSSLTAERTIALGERLRRYNTTAIRKFASLYKRSIKKLNDYRAWDFVYIMEGGCGDDSFMDFKETIVFLGRPELIDLVLERPVEAVELLSTIPNVALQEEYGLSSVIDFACLARSGTVSYTHLTLPTILRV